MESSKRQKTLWHFFAKRGTQPATTLDNSICHSSHDCDALFNQPGETGSGQPALEQCSSQQLHLSNQSGSVQPNTAVGVSTSPSCSTDDQPKVRTLCQLSSSNRAADAQSDKPLSCKALPSNIHEDSKDCSTSSSCSAEDAEICSLSLSTDTAAEPPMVNAYEQQVPSLCCASAQGTIFAQYSLHLKCATSSALELCA